MADATDAEIANVAERLATSVQRDAVLGPASPASAASPASGMPHSPIQVLTLNSWQSPNAQVPMKVVTLNHHRSLGSNPNRKGLCRILKGSLPSGGWPPPVALPTWTLR